MSFFTKNPNGQTMTPSSPSPTRATHTQSPSMIITGTSGKQYSLDNNTVNWVKSRYKQDMAGSYGLDDADQLAKRNGQLSASALKTYKNSNVDRQLAELGLPSEKNLEKYLESYNQWHTGGMDQYFGQANLPKDYWTKTKGWYQSDMQNAYENTAEDQQRKARGLMPSKWEAKYTDTEIDDQLRARGLPPISEFNTYRDRWNNYQGIENFYANVALADTNLRLQGINDDDKEYSIKDPQTGEVIKTGIGKDLYADNFFDELEKTNEDGSYMYAPIRSMFKNGAKPTTSAVTGDYAYDRGAAITASNKEEANDTDYASYNAFSYDDYKKHYDDLYNRYFANQQTNSGQLVRDVIATRAREADEEATRSFYDPKEGEELAFIQQWRKENPKGTAEDMFSDMLSNGASIQTARRVMRTARAPENSESIYGGKNKRDDGWGWSDIGKGFVNAKTGDTPKMREEEADNRKDARYDVEAGDRANATFDASGEKADNKIETVQNLASAYDAAYKAGDRDALYSITQKLRALDIASREAADTWLKENADLYSLDNAIEKAKSYMDSNGKWTLENKEAALLQLRRDGFDADTVNAASEHLQLHYGTASNTADDEKAKLSTPEQVSSWMLDYAQTHGDTQRGEWTEEKANEMFKTLDKQGVPANVVMGVIEDEASFAQLAEYADQYYTGKKTSERINAEVQDGIKSANEFIDATLKEQGEDEVTIDSTKNAIRNTLAAIIDENDSVDVDTVLSVLDQVSKLSSTNYTAMKNALEDLGFSYGIQDDWAGDITAGWSDEDLKKLQYGLFDYMSGIDMKEPEANDKGGYITEKVADTLGDEWIGDHFVQNKVLDTERFEAAVEWAQQEIASGRRTEWEAYQVLAAMGLQDEMQTYMGDDWHRAHYIENVLPGLWATAEESERLLYDEMTPEERRNKDIEIWNGLSAEDKAAIYDSPYWWEADPSVYRTFGQSFRQQMKMVLPGLATEIVSTPVKILDAVTANISGRPEMWDSTQWLMNLQEGIAQYGSVTDNVNGSAVAATVSDVVQELGRMYWYGGIGGAIGSSFAGSTAGSAVMAASASNSAVVRGASKMFMSMVSSSPFVASAFANNYAEVKQLGASNKEATWFGLITGLSEGLLEGFEFDNLWGKVLGQKNFAATLALGKNTYLQRLGIIGKAWISSAAVSGLGEFTEESIGYVLETFLKMRHSDTWGKGTEWNTSDWLQQAMMGFLTGFFGGGIAAGGSFVSDGVKLANAMKNNPQLQASLPDILTGQGIANGLPESTMATYRDGGAEVMSKENYGNIIDQVADDYTAIFNAANLLDKTKAEAKAEYDTKVNEINATVSSAVAANVNSSDKLGEFVKKCKKLGISIDFDSIWNTDPSTWAAQIQAKAQAAKQNALDNARAEYETAVAKAEADYEGNVKQKQRLLDNNRKKIQEHYVGLYLQNEDLINSLSDEMLDNLAQAYQNGAKYEASKESSADIEVKAEAQSEVNDLVSQLKSNKQRLKSADVATRAFTDADEQSVKDAAKNIGYKGNVSFINDPNEKWSGKFNKNSGDIVLNRAYLTAYDVDGLQNNPAMWVLQHEMYHYVKEVGGEEFTKAAVNLIKGLPKFARLGADVSEAAYNQMLDTIAEKWTGLGINADDDVQTKRAKAEEELVAKFAETYLFGSESSIKMLAQTNGNIVEKMLGWLRYRIDELKLRRSKESYAKDILKLERMYAKALRDANEKFKPQKKGSTNTAEKSESTAQNTGKPVSDESYSAANVDIEELLDDEEEYAEPEVANPRTGVTKDQDEVYNSLVKKALNGKITANEQKILSNMIRDLAKKMGYDTVVYHGTNAFGFTKPDVKQSDDKLSFFATAAPLLARTYIPDEYMFDPTDVGITDIRNRGEGSSRMLSDYRRGKIHDALMTVFSEAYRSNPNRSLGLFTDAVIEEKAKKFADKFVTSFETMMHDDASSDWKTYLSKDMVYNKASEIAGDELSQDAQAAIDSLNEYLDLEALDDEERSKVGDIIRDNLSHVSPAVRDAILKMNQEDAAYYNGVVLSNTEDLIKYMVDSVNDNGVDVITEFTSDPVYDDPDRMTQYADVFSEIEALRDSIETELQPYLESRDPAKKNIKSGGTYKLYANTSNMYVVGDDSKVQNWDTIKVPDDVADEMRSMGIRPKYHNRPNEFRTRAIGQWAKAKGHDGVIYKNIYDSGGQSQTYGGTPGTVYNFFKPETQLRSADDITMDDKKNLIPYSQRFDPESGMNDFRYSRANFDIDDLLNEYGAIEPGREPRARDVQVPKQTSDYNRVSQWIRSLIESGKLTDDQAQNVLRMVVEQDYGTYVPTSQAERMEEARAYIAERQPLQAQQEFHDMVMQGRFGVKTNAIGIQLLSDASARGDIASVLDIASDLQLAATEAGQSAQIFNVLKELKGVGSAWYMQKVIDRMNAKYADRIKAGKMNRISVDPALMAELAKATTVDQMAAAEEAVAKDIARQLPLTWDDRLSSWRYFSMLANPTTHIRNITGNLLMKGLNTAKDAVAAGLENLFGIDQGDRAHAILSQADKNIWRDWVQQSYEEQARNLSGGSKLGFESFVKQNMRSFDNKIANALAQFNFNALEKEDIAFIKPAYKNALMQYMVAQGYTLNEKGQAGKVDAKGKFREMSKAQMNEAIDWASQQAWKQTFRDASSLATMLNKLSKENAVSRLLVEGVMPFKKTPINIARRGVDYSPAGIIKGIAQLTNGVKKGKVTTAQAIDTLSSGLTGSALMALGVMLAKLGVIRAGGEKDKKLETFLEDTGDQTYAMKFGDKSINMSSIAPATIPLFMGVALNEMIEQGGDTLDLSTITDTIAGTLNPFMEMSFMSSLNSALKNYNANGIGGALGSTLLTAAQNYGSQYLPTLGGKIAQFLDPTRRTTKSDITSPVGSNMDYYARSLAKKVPGLESTLQPDVDVWGRTDTKDTFGEWAWDFANKFILPTNVKTTNRDSVDNELIRIVESTGVTDFLPSDGAKYFTVNKVKYEMNAKQYAQYSQDRGQAAYAALKDVMAGASYQRASDEEKAAMLKKALDAAYKQVSNQWKEKLGAYNK